MLLRFSNRHISNCPSAERELGRMLLCALICALGLFALIADATAQNVSIGTATANNSALLHMESTTKGLLIPRVTNTQMNAISSPATGDLVWNSTYTNFYYYNGTY